MAFTTKISHYYENNRGQSYSVVAANFFQYHRLVSFFFNVVNTGIRVS